jgi:outer membrane protein assembly factor BamB
LRLGQLAAQAPDRTAFLVALERQVWVFPSAAVEVRLVKNGAVEPLAVPQVVRLDEDSRVEVIARETGEAVALASVHAEAPEAFEVHDAPAGMPERSRARPAISRAAALSAAGAALVVFTLFRVLAARSPGETTPPDPQVSRGDAWVEPDLESRVLGALGDPSRDENEEGRREASGAEPESKAGKKPNEEWTFRARAPITSSPLVAGEAVVFGSRDSTLYCVDAESGAPLWALSAGSGVGSSPRAARGIVVVGTYAGRVLAVDLKSGRKKWEGRTGGKIVSSPCLLEDLAVIGSNDAGVHAFRLSDGEKVWVYETKGAVRATAEPIGAERVVIGSSDGSLHAIDTRTGRAVWKRDTGSSIYASAAFDERSNRVFAGTKDGRVLCVGAQDGSVVWSATLGTTVNARPRILEDCIVVGTNGGKLYALDPATGKSRWSLKGRRGFDASPAAVGETVVAPAYDGTMYFVNAADGTVRGTRDLGSEVWSSPAAVRDVVYIGTFAGSMHALAVP